MSWKAGASTNSQASPSFHGPRASISPWSPSPVESLKNWSTRPAVGANAADREGRLLHALQRGREGLHVGDLARHQELKRVLGAGIAAEIDEALVDDLGPRLGGDVAAQIDVELAGDLQVIRGPRIAHRVEQVDAAAAGDRDQRIGLGLLAREFHRLEVHAGEAADDLQMAQLLGADVHQQVFALRILAIEALDGILHGRGELAVGAAELLEQHVAEPRIGLVDPHRVHEFLDVMIHERLAVRMMSPAGAGFDEATGAAVECSAGARNIARRRSANSLQATERALDRMSDATVIPSSTRSPHHPPHGPLMLSHNAHRQMLEEVKGTSNTAQS